MKKPCEYVSEWMEDMRIPLEKAKRHLVGDYKAFMDGKMRIDEAMAKRIELFTGLPKEKWLHIQNEYDKYLAEKTKKKEEEIIKPFL